MASSPMEMETPGAEGGQERPERGTSPCKKQKAEEAGGLTLDMIREAMRAELGKSRDELGASIASVREEVAFFSKRVDSIEAGVTRQMDTTNKMLTPGDGQPRQATGGLGKYQGNAGCPSSEHESLPRGPRRLGEQALAARRQA